MIACPGRYHHQRAGGIGYPADRVPDRDYRRGHDGPFPSGPRCLEVGNPQRVTAHARPTRDACGTLCTTTDRLIRIRLAPSERAANRHIEDAVGASDPPRRIGHRIAIGHGVRVRHQFEDASLVGLPLGIGHARRLGHHVTSVGSHKGTAPIACGVSRRARGLRFEVAGAYARSKRRERARRSCADSLRSATSGVRTDVHIPPLPTSRWCCWTAGVEAASRVSTTTGRPTTGLRR